MLVTGTEVPVILYLVEFSDWYKSPLVMCTVLVQFDRWRIFKAAFWLLGKQITDCIYGLNLCSAVYSSDGKHSPERCFKI